MSKEINDQIIDGHEYDGIKELNNPLPNWWIWLFYFSIMFSFLYYIHYEISLAGPTSDQELAANMEQIKALKTMANDLQSENQTQVSLQSIIANTQQLSQGQKAFAQYCASCHGDKGQGSIGPNLTDKFWIHSKGTYEGITKAINEGFPAKGMPPWKSVIPNNKRAFIAAFVTTLKGTSSANAKAPQGQPIED